MLRHARRSRRLCRRRDSPQCRACADRRTAARAAGCQGASAAALVGVETPRLAGAVTHWCIATKTTACCASPAEGAFDDNERRVLASIAADLASSVRCARRNPPAARRAGSPALARPRFEFQRCDDHLVPPARPPDRLCQSAFERISGYSAAEVVGQSGRFLVRDDLPQKGLNEIRAAAAR